MKRMVALLLVGVMSLGLVAGCGMGEKTPATTPETTEKEMETVVEKEVVEKTEKASGPVELTVVTSYGADDGNRGNYETAYKAYEVASGNKIKDASGMSNEEWKAKVMTDFETGSEPDVLFYFNGVDANKIVEAGKVVSIDEIRALYPDYATNMKDELLGASPVDGMNYSVPVNGYWEGLYVNKKVLAQCEVEVPGADYTWDQFLMDCEKIKESGYTPIAASIQEVPHYWFEFTALNNGNVTTHGTLPTSATDPSGTAWVSGLQDIKALYDAGYLPKNTTTAGDPETFQLMADNKAAFAIDGSWKLGWFQENAENIDDFTVTYVPAKNDRKATDMIGGLSMGYYITKKAWDNPEKQAACVDFITAMTTDEVVSTFGATAVTALVNGTMHPADADTLVEAALALTKGATSVVPAAQDMLSQAARNALFADVKNVVSEKTTAAAAVEAALAVK